MNMDAVEQSVILIVDDTPANLGVLFDFLADSGFRILVAEDGESAIRIAEYANPNLILLDILMPVMDGFETCRRLKANEQTKDIPVIFLTALAETVDKVKGLDLGAVDYITKPLQAEEVLARVKLHLSLRNLAKQLQTKNSQLEQEIAERKRIEANLQEQTAELTEWKNRYEAVVQASHQILYDWNSQTNELIYSSSLEQILGYSSQEITNGLQGWIALVHPDDQELFTAEIKRVIETKTSFYLKFRVLHKDGTYIPVEDTGFFFFNAAGNIERMVGFVTDIRDRQRREEALRETTQMLQALVQSSPLAILVLDADYNVRMWNPAAEKMFGWSEAEVLGSPLPIVPKAKQHEFQVLCQRVLQGESLTQMEVRRQKRNGSSIDVSISTAPLHNATGQTHGIMAVLTDITERNQAEQKIHEQAALLNITTDAILVRDLDNQILFWNQGAERLYGWKSSEIKKQGAVALFSEKMMPQMLKAQKAVLNHGEWQGRLHQVTKDGRKIMVESRWTLMRGEDSQPKSILVVNTDITEKQHLEAQFLRAQRMQSIGTLAGGIAHDLNNLLTPILSSAQLLRMQVQLPDEKKQQLLQVIEMSTKRGAALVKQVLAFARGVEGKRTTLQAQHLITEMKHIALETFPKNIEVQTDVANGLWMVSGDATQLHQVLMNLCINANEAMPQGGTLSIRATNVLIDQSGARLHLDAKVGPYVLITIADTGMGIAAEVIDRIFEPFFTTKELGQGTGLGLSTVHMIVKSHGGFMDVTSTTGRGTQFKVYLPAIPAVEVSLNEDYEVPPGKGELILVVDDEAAIREANRVSLEAYNYRALTACDGIEAVALYAEHKDEINLVLVDMMMPSMDGAMAIRTLQRINPQVKIIAVSGLVADTQMPETPRGDLQVFLAKPYTVKELLKTIQQVLCSET